MTNANSKSRVIALVDMDCFYCQVEERYDPSLKGVPAAVVQYKAFKGGSIIAVNYEARARGVNRYMKGDDAKAVCPEIILVRVPEVNEKADLTKYRNAGKEVVDVLCEFSTNVERASVDEAYIDLTEAINKFIASQTKDGEELVSCLFTIDESTLETNFPLGHESSQVWLESLRSSEMVSLDDVRLALGAEIVGRMRQAVYEKTGFRCSAGIAHNKILAKLGAGLNKPNKQTVISQEAVPELFATTKLTKVRSLGGQFGELLVKKLKCEFMSDLLNYSIKQLQQLFGDERGEWLYQLARGYDYEPVTKRQLPQSIGCSKNFFGREALDTKEKTNFWIHRLCIEVVERLQRDWEMNNRRAKLLTLHVRFHDQKGISRSCGKNVPYNVDRLSSSVITTMERLYQQFGVNPINNLGLIASKLEDESSSNKKIDSFFGVQPRPQQESTLSAISVNDDILFKKSIVSKQVSCNTEQDTSDSDIEIMDETSMDTDVKDVLDNYVEEQKNDVLLEGEKTPQKIDNQNVCHSPEKRKPFFVCSTSPLKTKKLVLPQNNSTDITKNLPSSTTIVPADSCPKSASKITSVSKNSNQHVSTSVSVSDNLDNYDDAIPCCSKSLPQQNGSISKPKNKHSETDTADKDAKEQRALSKEYLQICDRCSKEIPLWEYLSHLDFHVAMDLQNEFNKNGADSIANNNNETNFFTANANPSEKNSSSNSGGMANKRGAATSVGGKSRGGSSKRGRPDNTKPSAQMKTLDSYFLSKN